MKAVTYLIATPEEVLNALTDEKLRPLWDNSVKTVEKQLEDCIRVTY